MPSPFERNIILEAEDEEILVELLLMPLAKPLWQGESIVPIGVSFRKKIISNKFKRNFLPLMFDHQFEDDMKYSYSVMYIEV